MKTVQKGSDIKRVNDSEAESLVRFKGYVYAPKSIYKEQFGKKKEEPVVVETAPIVEEQPKVKFKKGKKKEEKA